MITLSVVIPVKNGERYLTELLDAVVREGVDEILVIDSGSEDQSVRLARHAGARVIEIDMHEFGHGRTRNLGAEETSGDLIAFLTQDATPVEGWASALREAFTLDPRVGAAFGPHLPRPGSSPMVARELLEFFAGFSHSGDPVVQRPPDPTFLSNANACYSRECWSEVRFRDLEYAEDQAFGKDMFNAGWWKVYHPRAAVLHSHDYSTPNFMRRYFEEYRGLRTTMGHVEPWPGWRTPRAVTQAVRSDLRFVAPGSRRTQLVKWGMRSAAHHGGRALIAPLGSRSGSLPLGLRQRLSLEQQGGKPDPATKSKLPEGPVHTKAVPRLQWTADAYESAYQVWAEGVEPLLPPVPGMSKRDRLRIALVVPPFSRGSGGHNTLFQLLSRLEQRGYLCSVWMTDFLGRIAGISPAVLRHDIVEHFAPIQGPVYHGFDDWFGADLVLATGWQTVHHVLRLPNCYARAYIVNDHEPEFFAASVEGLLAADSYRHGLHCIAASPWLRDLLIQRYGVSADAFQLGVDQDTYRPRPVPRRQDTVVYYARYETPRRAVPVGLAALAELHRRRPDLRIVLFGSHQQIASEFPYEHGGVLSPRELSWLYSEATVGLCLSLTNFSLMPKEMLACGLPCVELAGVSAESIFGEAGPIELAPLVPTKIADAIERLLDDPDLWNERSRASLEFVANHTWDHATDEVEIALRQALSLREQALTLST